MEIARQENGSFILSEIESPMLEMLHAVPEACLPQGDAAAKRRLFQVPSEDVEFNEEWAEYVHPSQADWFENATDMVKDDLRRLLLGANEPQSLTIPAENVELWLNALNQARIALGARYAVSDDDMERPTEGELTTPREVALFQIHFYGFLQECFIKGLESLDDDDADQ